MESLHNKVIRFLAIAVLVFALDWHSTRCDSTSTKPTTYSPYNSLMYSPYSSMASVYSQYSPSMSSSMVMPAYYSSGGYPYGSMSPSMSAYGSYGQTSSYHPSQYMMAASYPQSAYVPMPYMGYSGSYSPISSYYG